MKVFPQQEEYRKLQGQTGIDRAPDLQVRLYCWGCPKRLVREEQRLKAQAVILPVPPFFFSSKKLSSRAAAFQSNRSRVGLIPLRTEKLL